MIGLLLIGGWKIQENLAAQQRRENPSEEKETNRHASMRPNQAL